MIRENKQGEKMNTYNVGQIVVANLGFSGKTVHLETVEIHKVVHSNKF